MKYFVEFVVSALVQHAEEVDVRESEGPEGISYRVRLNPLDIGRVIGKKGKTISAIRNLCNAAVTGQGKKIFVEIEEEAAAE